MNQKEIARLAGISVATVSRVLNGSNAVTENTRRRVLNVIEEYAYVQNANAKNLRTARSKSIGFLISNFSNPFFIDVYSGLENACRKMGFSIIVGNTNEHEDQERQAIDRFLGYRVEGIVASFVKPSQSVVRKLASYRTKVLMLDRLVDIIDADSVVIDNVNGGIEQVNHLAQLGHRRIAVIHGTLSDSNGKQRLQGFMEGMAANQLELRSEYVVPGHFGEESAYSATLGLMHLPTPPTAIIAHNNLMCMGAYKALRDMNLRIGEDVSLMGFDDFSLSQYLTPSITFIDRPVYQMGELAGKMIIERINGSYQGHTRRIVFPVKLHRGESCAPPR